MRACAALLAWTAGLWLGFAFVPPASRASDLSDFQRALGAYEAHDYPNAVVLFEELVGDPVPRLQTAALVLESRKYLAASYLFTNQPAAADQQFQRLLEQDPSYQLDPLGFPAEVEQAFVVVRERLRQQRAERAEEAAHREAEARRLETEQLFAERDRNAELVRLAETVRVERLSSRWIALLPFGAGQFQNGHTELGYVFAVTEGVLTATVAGTWLAHAFLKREHDRIEAQGDVSLTPSELDRANFQTELARTANRVSFVLLMAAIVVGVADAQWRFRPTVTAEERRALPDSLRPAVELSIAPGAFHLRVDL